VNYGHVWIIQNIKEGNNELCDLDEGASNGKKGGIIALKMECMAFKSENLAQKTMMWGGINQLCETPDGNGRSFTTRTARDIDNQRKSNPVIL